MSLGPGFGVREPIGAPAGRVVGMKACLTRFKRKQETGDRSQRQTFR